MRKYTGYSVVLLLFALMLTGVGTAQVADSGHGTLADLAAYVPQDALVYIGIRTDADSIAAFDALLAEVSAGLPNVGTLSVSDIAAAYELRLDELTWLGDAIGIAFVPDNTSTYGNVQPVLIVHLADPDAAQAYLSSRAGSSNVEFRGTVALIADSTTLARINASAGDALNQEPRFNDAINALDAPRYAALVYADLPAIIARDRGNSQRYAPAQQALLTTAFLRLLGAVAIGVTRAENGDLLMDVALTAPNQAGIAPFGLSIAPQSVSADALAAVPDDTFAIWHGANLLGLYLDLYAAFGDIFIEAAAETGINSATRFGASDSFISYLLGNLSAEQVAELLVGNVFGITMADVDNWLGSDYLLFLSINPTWPEQNDQSLTSPIDSGTIFSITDAAQSYAAFENLVRSLTLLRDSTGGWQAFDIAVRRTTGADGQQDSARLDLRLYSNRSTPPMLMSIAITDTIAVIGTTRAVDMVLERQVNGGDTATWLADAAAGFRPGAAFNAAVQPQALVPVLSAWLFGAPSADDIRPYLAKLELLTVNAVFNDDASAIIRFSARLNDAGAVETLLGAPTIAPVISTPEINTPVMMFPTPTPFILPEVTVDPIIATATAVADAQATAIAEATRFDGEATNAVLTMTAVATDIPPSPTFVPTSTATPSAPQSITASFRAADGAFTVGNPDVPVTVIVFADWACPHCDDYKSTVDELIASDVAQGRVNFEHRTLPTAGGFSTRDAARFAECADDQRPGIFFAVSDALFNIARDEGPLYRSKVALAASLSRSFELNTTALQDCAERANQVDVDMAYAMSLGVNSTPAVYLRVGNGAAILLSDRSIEAVRAAIARAGSSDTPGGDSTGDSESPDGPPNQLTRLANIAATRAAATPAP